jgi:hypothetical protein
MVMKKGDVDKRLRLMRRWDHACVVCGRRFASISCVTFEHLVPRSMGGTGRVDNIGPSHYSCNALRGTMSLIAAASLLERSLCTLQLAGGAAAVATFLAVPVPGRRVAARWESRFRMQASALKRHFV